MFRGCLESIFRMFHQRAIRKMLFLLNLVARQLGRKHATDKGGTWVALGTEGHTFLLDIFNILENIMRHIFTVFISLYTVMYAQNYLYHIFNLRN
jgi:hypothetical protein